MPFMLTRSLAHEILHNWWANGVFLDPSEGNWTEGLTTYMADYGLAERDNEETAWQMRLGWLRDFAALPDDRDRPVNSFRSKGHDADQVIGYNKVAMVFHMLKQRLGEEVFQAGLRDFWSAHRFKPAAWSDLKQSFETASGDKLDDFFEPWLTRKGAPSLSLDKAELRKSDPGFAIDLALSSDRPEYDLLIPVQIETSAGGVEERIIPLLNGKVEASLEVLEKPVSIGIDQRHDLFRHLAEDEAPPILRDVTLAADTVTVVAGHDKQVATLGQILAERMLDTGVRLAAIGDEAARNAPVLLIGLRADLPEVFAEAGMTPPPKGLGGEGTAQSWVAKRKDAPPILVVEAETNEALEAILRPLPHYGRQSFVVFEGGKAIDKGVWPTGDNALTKRFE